jgi:hypothetical protein
MLTNHRTKKNKKGLKENQLLKMIIEENNDLREKNSFIKIFLK